VRNPKGKPQQYTDEELLAVVRKCANYNQQNKMSGPWSETVARRFGSWNRAKELAGVGIQMHGVTIQGTNGPQKVRRAA